MEKRDLALSLLFLVVLASGCVNNGGQATEQESSESIMVHSLEAHPGEIYDGGSVRLSMNLVNAGQVDAEMYPGDKGTNILRDYCKDIFDVDDFQAQPNRLENPESSVLHDGSEVRLRWTLQQEGNVPLHGYNCDLKFQVPFNYSVSSYRQIQIKRDRTIEGTPNLQSESSSGPLLFAVQTVGGTGEEGRDTFVSGEDDSFRVLLQLQNTQETNYNKGVVEIDEESLTISADGPLEDFEEGYTDVTDNSDDSRCNMNNNNPDNPIRIFEGNSRVISCDFSLDEIDISSPSEIVEISASVDYTYLKDGGTRSIKVNYAGN